MAPARYRHHSELEKKNVTESRTKAYACPRCTVGRCSPQELIFTDMVQGQLLAIPNTPAYVCDICHFVEFASEAVEALWQELHGEQSELPSSEELTALVQQKPRSSFRE